MILAYYPKINIKNPREPQNTTLAPLLFRKASKLTISQTSGYLTAPWN